MNDLSAITPTPPQRHRFHLLDGLRGIAALMVADLHTASLVHAKVIAQSGPLAVDFFFCLSGFVIAFTYERRLLDGMRRRDFVAARMIRLYPMLFLGMTIGIVKPLIEQLHRSGYQILKAKGAEYAKAIFLIPSLSLHSSIGNGLQVFPLDNAAWSLFFELIANFAFAFIAVRRRVPVWLLLSSFLLSVSLIGFFALHGIPIVDMGSLGQYEAFLLGFARVGMSFCAGVLILRLYRATAHPPLASWLNAIIAMLTVLMLLFLLMAPYESMTTASFSMFTIIVLMPSAVYIGALVRLPRRLEGICSWLGEVSYPLYLLNIVLNYSLARLAWSIGAHLPSLHALLVPAVLAVDTLVAWAASRWFDVPVRRFLVRLYNSRKLDENDPYPRSNRIAKLSTKVPT